MSSATELVVDAHAASAHVVLDALVLVDQQVSHASGITVPNVLGAWYCDAGQQPYVEVSSENGQASTAGVFLVRLEDPEAQANPGGSTASSASAGDSAIHFVHTDHLQTPTLVTAEGRPSKGFLARARLVTTISIAISISADASILILNSNGSSEGYEQTPGGDCPAYDEAYPWDDLIPLARERATPFIGDNVQPAPWLTPDRPMP